MNGCDVIVWMNYFIYILLYNGEVAPGVKQ